MRSDRSIVPLTRWFEAEDALATAELFYQAVHVGARAEYSNEQLQAWAPSVPAIDNWQNRLSSQITRIAHLDDDILGIMSMTSSGKIDLAFVAPDQMGQGIADMLYGDLLIHAAELQLTSLQTEASHLAKRFFLKHGWAIVKRQSVVRNSVTITNFLMEKTLQATGSSPQKGRNA